MDPLYVTPSDIQLLELLLKDHWHICCREAFNKGLRDRLENYESLTHEDIWALEHAFIQVYKHDHKIKIQIEAIKQRLNIMDRSEQPRKNSSRPIMVSEYEQKKAAYIAKSKGCATIIFATAECDVLRLSNLLSECCYTRVAHSRSADFYESISLIGNTEHEVEDQAMNDRMRRYYCLNLMIGHGGFGACIINNLGMPGDCTESLIDLLRKTIDDGHRQILIAFMAQKDVKTPQYEKLRSFYELGDVVISEESLLEDPINTLVRLRPVCYPNKEEVEKILK